MIIAVVALAIVASGAFLAGLAGLVAAESRSATDTSGVDLI
ncbi:hypothetical protein [Methylobacterium sp. 10]|nr:hypothetical protein [Methylobacterium sp. 10]